MAIPAPHAQESEIRYVVRSPRMGHQIDHVPEYAKYAMRYQELREKIKTGFFRQVNRYQEDVGLNPKISDLIVSAYRTIEGRERLIATMHIAQDLPNYDRRYGTNARVVEAIADPEENLGKVLPEMIKRAEQYSAEWLGSNTLSFSVAMRVGEQGTNIHFLRALKNCGWVKTGTEYFANYDGSWQSAFGHVRRHNFAKIINPEKFIQTLAKDYVPLTKERPDSETLRGRLDTVEIFRKFRLPIKYWPQAIAFLARKSEPKTGRINLKSAVQKR